MAASTIDVSVLAEPVTFAFSGKSAPNRLLKAAMTERLCTYSEGDEFARGEPTMELDRAYAIWGKGGLGVIHTGNIMVHRTHLEAKGCAILDHEIPKSYVPAFVRLQRAATSQSQTPPILIGQLVYLDREAPASDRKEHPLVNAERRQQTNVTALARWTHEGIRDITERFAFAARALNEANFDGVQIHCAYGNIITYFLSRHTNTRTDEYGGLLENRSRLLLEIISAVKARVCDPSFIIGVKLNATDFLNGGLPAQEPHDLARKLEEAQVDYVELSGGSYEGSDLKDDPRQEHFLRFSNQIRAGLIKTRLAVTGGFKIAATMISTVESGATDFVGLARSLAHEPTLAAEILAGRTSCAKPNRLPTSLAVNLEAGISQIQRMGKGLELIDFNDKQVADEWLNEFQMA